MTTVSLLAPGMAVPRGVGVPGLPPAEGPALRALPDAPSAAAAPAIPGGFVSPEEPRITVSLSKIPFSEALNYITNLAKLKWRIEENVVRIVSVSEPDPVRQKTFRIRPVLFPDSNEVERRESAETHAMLVRDPRNFLIASGVELAKEDAVSVNDDGTMLTVQATDAELVVIGAVLDKRSEHYYEIGQACAASERARRKASAIILPTSEFANVPLDLALKKLQSEGILHDPASAKAESGVKIRFEQRKPVRGAETETPPEAAAPNAPTVPGLEPAVNARSEQGPLEKWVTVIKTDPIPKVTGSAKDISLLEAVSAIARMAGYRAYIQAGQFVVRSPDVWDDMLTKEYRVPPGLGLGEAPTTEVVKRLLTGQEEKLDIWKAVYIRSSRSLVVQMRDEATIDAMDAAIDRAWFDYFAKKRGN